MRGLALSCLLPLLAGAQAPAQSLAQTLAQPSEAPMPPDARAPFERGLRLYNEKNYEAALVELREAYAIATHSEILFAIAQAERLAGRCEEADKLYRQFLERSPNPEHAEAAKAAMSRCESAAPPPAVSPVVPPPPPPPVVAPVESVHSQPTPRPVRAWYTDPWGGVLAGLGVASAGVGIALFAVSSSKADDAQGASTYDLYGDEFERAKGQRLVSVVLFGTGAAFVTAAIVRYAVAARR